MEEEEEDEDENEGEEEEEAEERRRRRIGEEGREDGVEVNHRTSYRGSGTMCFTIVPPKMLLKTLVLQHLQNEPLQDHSPVVMFKKNVSGDQCV